MIQVKVSGVFQRRVRIQDGSIPLAIDEPFCLTVIVGLFALETPEALKVVREACSHTLRNRHDPLHGRDSGIFLTGVPTILAAS